MLQVKYWPIEMIFDIHTPGSVLSCMNKHTFKKHIESTRARMQPCFALWEITNKAENPPFDSTCLLIFSWNCLINLTNLSRQSNVVRICHKVYLFTMVQTSTKSVNVNIGACLAPYTSTMNNMLTVPLPGLKQYILRKGYKMFEKDSP